ncbi:hypothetical protein J3Q64DRAFT_1254282 [Phycomyces blakesleeanus]|uniref:Uncharacterized protein n=1 Tax=Phycomyces blakesleeanus TaxID=4837 RepID=A0ABR3AR90_PHYBL
MESSSQEILTSKERQILNSQREIDWLQRQIQKYEKDFETPAPSTSNVSHDVNEDLVRYKARVDELRSEVSAFSQFNLGKNHIVQNLEASHFTRQALYPDSSDHARLMQSQPVQVAIDKRDALVVEFMKEFEELRAIKEQLSVVERQVLALHQENRQQMESIEMVTGIPLTGPIGSSDMSSQLSSEGSQGRMRQDGLKDMQYHLEVTRNVLLYSAALGNDSWLISL